MRFTEYGLMSWILRGSADNRSHQGHRKNAWFEESVRGLAIAKESAIGVRQSMVDFHIEGIAVVDEQWVV